VVPLIQGAAGAKMQRGGIMPLDNGSGVLVGVLDGYRRDEKDNQGRWFHDNLMITAAGQDYRAAVDVDSHQSQVGVQWKIVATTATELARVLALPEGYHALAAVPGSGALDHVRAALTGTWRLRWRPVGVLGRTLWVPFLQYQPWTSGNNEQAATALEGILTVSAKVLVWGEPFTTGLGMHNVHQNQGDPAGSQWWTDDGVWQDGGVAAPRPDGSYLLFVSKFTSQSSRTDDAGHPV
jgi:uncharacterized protein YukJ